MGGCPGFLSDFERGSAVACQVRANRIGSLPSFLIICLGFAPILLFPAVAGRAAAADPFAKAQREGVTPNPKALTFAIRLKDNKNRFHLRVEPGFGAEQLMQVLAPATRNRKGCYSGVQASVARLHACPELDEVAIRHLDDPDAAVVLDAVETMGRYGSAAAEAPLWKRFEKWHDEWKEKAEELQPWLIGPPPKLDDSSRIGPALSRALAYARGGLADAEKLKRIRALCLTEWERQHLDYPVSAAESVKKRLSFMPLTAGIWRFEVAQYNDLTSMDELKAKLAQFPKGTVFLWNPFNAGQLEEQKKAMCEELKTFLSDLGMSLENPESPKMSIMSPDSSRRKICGLC
jgi:hypothetical protein